MATIDLIEEVAELFEVIITYSVLRELEEFSKFDDPYGKASKNVIKCKTNFVILDVDVKETVQFIEKTDNELYNLANEKSLPIITDDIKLSRHISGNIETHFSSFFLQALISSGNLSKEKALNLLEKLRDLRNWRNNLIYLTTKEFIEKM